MTEIMSKNTPYCPPFVEMAPIIPEDEVGAVAVKHMVVSDETASLQRLGGLFSGKGGEWRDFESGTYCKLVNKEKQTIEMSDTPMERRTNLDFIRNAHGDVLIGGLGIGMIIVPLLMRDNIVSITVVEINKDVIELVWKHIVTLPRRCTLRLFNEDVIEWRPAEKGVKFDSLYFDIWPDICADNWDEMKAISRSWWHWRTPKKENPDAFMSLWRKEDVQREAYKENDYYW